MVDAGFVTGPQSTSTPRAIHLIWRPLMEAIIALLSDPQVWIAFFTLTALELVLGIDNIIFISILVDKLPPRAAREGAPHRPVPRHVHARRPAAGAVVDRGPHRAAVHHHRHGHLRARSHPASLGGLFLVWKSTMEIHQLTEGEEGHASTRREGAASPPSSCRSSSSTWCSRSTPSSPRSAWSTRSR